MRDSLLSRNAFAEPLTPALSPRVLRGEGEDGTPSSSVPGDGESMRIRLRNPSPDPWVVGARPRCAGRRTHIEGFDLHANVSVRAGDNRRLERLCHYILRPPVPQDARDLTPDGKVLLRFRRPWRDGTQLPLEAPCPPAGRRPEWLAGMRTGAEDQDQTPRRWDDGSSGDPRNGTVCSRFTFAPDPSLTPPPPP
jgi:hypothetical protein